MEAIVGKRDGQAQNIKEFIFYLLKYNICKNTQALLDGVIETGLIRIIIYKNNTPKRNFNWHHIYNGNNIMWHIRSLTSYSMYR